MNIVKTALSATTMLAALTCAPARGQTHDTANAIVGNATSPASFAPNWSAVRVTGTGCNTPGTLAPLSNAYTGSVSSAIRGRHGMIAVDQPIVARNFATAPVTGNAVTVPAGGVILHPGPENECAILRLTIPSGGRGAYSVTGQFTAADANVGIAGDGVTGMVLRNGVRIGNVVNTARDRQPASGRTTLCPGDTVDFAVHMNGQYQYDTTLLTGQVRRVGDVGLAACVTAATTGANDIDPRVVTDNAVEMGEPISMIGTPNNPRSNCCAPWAGVDIIPALSPMFPNGAGGAYTHSFAISSATNAQIGAYLNYLHALNSSVTTLTMTVQAANLGTGATAAGSGTTIGGPQTITWTWTPGGATMSGGGFWTGAPFPLSSWIGFQTTIAVNGGPAGNALLGPDCRNAWSAWRAQPQQVLQSGSSGTVVLETIGARGQVIRSRPVQVTPGANIQPNQLPRN